MPVKADLRSNFSLEETTLDLGFPKPRSQHQRGCISQVEDIPQMQCDEAWVEKQ